MSKFQNPQNNQKGASLLLLILLISTLIGSIVYTTSIYFANMQLQLIKQRDRVFAIQVLQEFAVQAQKANDNYINFGNTCPGGYTLHPAGSQFCWHGTLAPSSEVCVKDPRNGSLICLDTGGTARAAIASLILRRNISDWERFNEIAQGVFESRTEILAMVEKDLSALLSGYAFAAPAGMDIYLPDLGTPPTNDITAPTCNGVTISDFCKVCGAGGNVKCVEMRVCLDSSCTNASPFSRYYRQRLGVI